jgi:hypothetical protein
MKNNLLLIIIHSLIAASSCIAMENLDIQKYIRFEQPKILSEITIIKQPLQAEYLDENRILVNGKDGCCIIDPRTNKEVKRIDVQAPYFAIHPTTRKIAFAGEKPAIYSNAGDLETLIKTKNQLYVTQSIFNPLYNEILLEHGIELSRCYDCKTGYVAKMEGPNDISFVAFHPTQEFYYICHHIGGEFSKPCIEIYNTTTLSPIGRINLNDDCGPDHILCSPNGSLIAVQDKDIAVCIIKKDHDNNTQTSRIELAREKGAESTIHWRYMKFHNNSTVLAIVQLLWIGHEYQQMVLYWDIITQQLLATTPALSGINYHNICENIAFSPDGRKIIIVSPDKCVILPVPYEVLYDTTEKLPYLYWFLSKESLAQHDIPNDVQKIVAFNVLETKFKR